MTETFTASNGKRVATESEEGGFTVGYMPLTGKEVAALREFFQHERDKELGRWRSTADPEWVVYENGHDAAVAIHEPSGVVHDLKRGHVFPEQDTLSKISEEYFAAHPEPKPWHGAEAGEVWALEHAAGGETAWYVSEDFISGESTFVPVLSTDPDLVGMGTAAPGIKSARKIWPEVKP